jgi:endonuclease/exonuclease/phosphatase family metal-dependent hydrolase
MANKYYGRILLLSLSLILFRCFSVYADTLNKANNHVYIASFNVYKLGGVAIKYKEIDDWEVEVDSSIPTRIANLADVIAVGGFHIVALQEVQSGPKGYFAIKDLQKALKENHNMQYRFFISGYIGRGLVPESMAFLYRPHKAKYKRINGERSERISIPGRDLVKTQWVSGDFDFTLISAHLAWGNEEHRDKGYEKIKDIFDNPENYSTDPDIVVLGDFNRYGKGYESVKKLPYDSSKFGAPNITFFDPQFNSKKSVTTTSIHGKGVPNDNPQLISTTVAENTYVYDMILISSDTTEEFPPGGGEAEYGKDFGIIHFDEPDGFGYQENAENMSHNDLKEKYSDHRPLWIRFKTILDEHYDGTWE